MNPFEELANAIFNSLLKQFQNEGLVIPNLDQYKEFEEFKQSCIDNIIMHLSCLEES